MAEQDDQKEKLLGEHNNIAKSDDSNEDTTPLEEGHGKDLIRKRALLRAKSMYSLETEGSPKDAFSNALKQTDTPIKVTFRNLTYTVKVPTTNEERKQRPERKKD